jgi:photosynthetic reaction center cytochrome c subunit
MRFGSRRMISVAVATVVLCLFSAVLASGQVGDKPQMAEEVFKNVPALKGIPVDEFMDTMGMIAAALSMNCVDCHTKDSVDKWENFATDTPLKRRARGMIEMVNGINKANFGGRRMVTCYTCHRGDRTPKVEPSLTVQYGAPIDDPQDVLIPAGGLPGAPTADQVFNKYIQALGGAQRVAAMTSWVAKGTWAGYDTDQAKAPVEIYAKAPNMRALNIHANFGESVRTFDGRAAWIASADRPVPLMPLTAGNLDGAKVDATLAFPSQIKGAFATWKVGMTTIDDKEVTVLQGSNPGKTAVNLYFDESGLLVRALRHSVTLIGTVPIQYEFSDYRVINGVKFPYKWLITWTDGQDKVEFSEVQTNIPIDNAKFAKPAPAPPIKQ